MAHCSSLPPFPFPFFTESRINIWEGGRDGPNGEICGRSAAGSVVCYSNFNFRSVSGFRIVCRLSIPGVDVG